MKYELAWIVSTDISTQLRTIPLFQPKHTSVCAKSFYSREVGLGSFETLQLERLIVS